MLNSSRNLKELKYGGLSTGEEVECFGEIPTPRYGHTTSLFENQKKVYSFGGFEDSSELSNDLYTFDLTTKEWEKIKFDKVEQLPAPRYHHQSTILQQYLIIHGGKSKTEVFSDTWILNIGEHLLRPLNHFRHT